MYVKSTEIVRSQKRKRYNLSYLNLRETFLILCILYRDAPRECRCVGQRLNGENSWLGALDKSTKSLFCLVAFSLLISFRLEQRTRVHIDWPECACTWREFHWHSYAFCGTAPVVANANVWARLLLHPTASGFVYYLPPPFKRTSQLEYTYQR